MHYKEVDVQTLWAEKKHIKYFVVQNEAQNEAQNQRLTQQESSSDNAWHNLQARYNSAQKLQSERQRAAVEETAHISELTPWLRQTGFHAHLQGLPLDDIPTSYQLPDEVAEPELAAFCSSVDRVLRKGMALLQDSEGQEERQLSRLQAKLLNTFRRVEMSQDPIRPLQNSQSKANYVLTWKKLVCYYVRVTQDSCLHVEGKHPFRPTQQQQDSFTAAWRHAKQLCQMQQQQYRDRYGRDESSEEVQDEEEANTEEGEREDLDHEILHFSLSLIMHQLDKRAFNSPMVSFAAVLAWNPINHTWKDVGNYTSYLSQIIYNCQLLVLLHSLLLVDTGKAKHLTSCLTSVRNQWLLNDTPGPVAELLGIRLLGFEISKNTVNQAQVRWHSDEQTIVCQDTQLHMDQLQDLIAHQLQAATVLMQEDLCFGVQDVPTFEPGKLVDNWDASSPGQSFLTDSRNSSYITEGQSWLFNQLQQKPELLQLLCNSKRSSGTTAPWKLSSTAVARYEASRQRFLEHMMVLLHLSSGQPARRPEILGIRWCNRQADKRNLFIHDGYLLFILTYHKSLNMTSSSRFPVRFVLPEAGQLLLQYLILIRPFCNWLVEETGSPCTVSEYLWHNQTTIWSEDKMTRILRSHTAKAIGVPLTVQTWRQLAVGIAIKKFSRKGCQLDLDLDLNAERDASLEQASETGLASNMPEAVHWQASHTPRTGNAVYGGTVNFSQGLTDAGLQEYLHASQLWHSLCRHPLLSSQRLIGAKHARSESTRDVGSSLKKQLAFRKSNQGCQTIWTLEQAITVLRQMYGPRAAYKGHQGQAVQAIISNRLQVVAVLGTGEGKSLLYQLPARLPGAGTTILVVPLVALKQDTVRRCQQLGVECSVWNSDQQPSLGCPLLLVSLDQAVQTSFLTYANQLDAANLLARVILDESHLVCTADSYRNKMAEVKKLRMLHCQFVFLTATLPPQMEAQFEAALLLKHPLYIRSLTTRLDLEYHVFKLPPSSCSQRLETTVAGYIRDTLQQSWFTQEGAQARALIYVRTKTQADKIAQELGCPTYYSDSGTDEEKATVLRQWTEGESDVLAATSALAGLDYPHVRAIFHIDEPSGGIIDFAQDTGRAGRDGKGGLSVVFLPSSWQASYNKDGGELLPENTQAMQRFLDSPRCRLVPLSQYLDGQIQSCQDRITACDRCRDLGLLPQGPISAEADEDNTLPIQAQDRQMEEQRDEQGDDIGLSNALLRKHNSKTARQLDQYLSGLELLRNSCVICHLVVEQEADHTLEQCRSTEKWQFISAKRKAQQQGTLTRGGWLARFGACFYCGNIQAICQEQGKGECRYKDVLMPLCWSVLHKAGWRERVLKELPTGLAASSEEEKYMLWLGERAAIFGEQGTNMAAVGWHAIQAILEDNKM